MTEPEAREAICGAGRSLFERGYVHGTAGNISVRLDESEGGGYLITPTDACLGFLDSARLARLDADGRQVGGDRASKTIALHAAIYAAASVFDPGTRCAIHTHSTHCVVRSLEVAEPELLPPITPYFVMKVGHVPLVPYHRPGDPAAAAQVARAIRAYGEAGSPIRAVMLARLGPVVWHDSPMSAMAVLEELEETARLMTLAPNTRALDDSRIEDLRRVFAARW